MLPTAVYAPSPYPRARDHNSSASAASYVPHDSLPADFQGLVHTPVRARPATAALSGAVVSAELPAPSEHLRDAWQRHGDGTHTPQLACADWRVRSRTSGRLAAMRADRDARIGAQWRVLFEERLGRLLSDERNGRRAVEHEGLGALASILRDFVATFVARYSGLEAAGRATLVRDERTARSELVSVAAATVARLARERRDRAAVGDEHCVGADRVERSEAEARAHLAAAAAASRDAARLREVERREGEQRSALDASSAAAMRTLVAARNEGEHEAFRAQAQRLLAEAMARVEGSEGTTRGLLGVEEARHRSMLRETCLLQGEAVGRGVIERAARTSHAAVFVAARHGGQCSRTLAAARDDRTRIEDEEARVWLAAIEEPLHRGCTATAWWCFVQRSSRSATDLHARATLTTSCRECEGREELQRAALDTAALCDVTEIANAHRRGLHCVAHSDVRLKLWGESISGFFSIALAAIEDRERVVRTTVRADHSDALCAASVVAADDRLRIANAEASAAAQREREVRDAAEQSARRAIASEQWEAASLLAQRAHIELEAVRRAALTAEWFAGVSAKHAAAQHAPLRIAESAARAALAGAEAQCRSELYDAARTALHDVRNAKRLAALAAKARKTGRPFLGFSLAEKNLGTLGRLTALDNDLHIDAVYRDGPAWRAGMGVNDVICEVGGIEVTSLAHVRHMIQRSAKVGGTLDLAVRKSLTGELKRCSIAVLTSQDEYKELDDIYFDTARHEKIERAKSAVSRTSSS